MADLSPRQRQVADLVAKGLTEREIAERIGISRFTVRNHKQVVYHKTGARNAVELTLIVNDLPDLVA